MDDVLISVIEQFGQLSWAIRALIASYYQQIGANLAVEDRSSVENRGQIQVGLNSEEHHLNSDVEVYLGEPHCRSTSFKSNT